MNGTQLPAKRRQAGIPTTVGGCPLRTAVGAIGGRWKPLVLHYLLQHPHGFGELRRACDDVANKTPWCAGLLPRLRVNPLLDHANA